ncbi:MAG TPA: methyltransferase [Anaerolineae bacterium]|nr:methyltransferase [Anaerolineae bacterium]
MNSRQRVLTALAHREPDRVPVDLGATRVTGITAVAYNRLKAHLGLAEGSTKVFDISQQLAEVEEEILERFGVDVIPLNRVQTGFEIMNWAWKEWRLPDGSPCLVSTEFDPVREEERDRSSWALVRDGVVVARMPARSFYFTRVHHPLAGAITKEDIDAYPWPTISDEELAHLRRRARHLYENTDYAIVGEFGGNILEWGQDLRGWDVFLMDLVIHKDLAHHLMDRMVECWLRNLERYLEAVGDYIQIIQMGDDLGTQHGPQISPQLYREMIKPRHQRVYGTVKEQSDIYVFLHSCGDIFDFIPDLIEAGVDILNPVQTSARGMDPVALKREFGHRITFWGGGCDTQRVLPRGTPEEVREDVRERLRVFAPGGGYVFAAVHNIQPDVPPENLVAMFQAVREFGR